MALGLFTPIFLLIGFACIITAGNRLRRFYRIKSDDSRAFVRTPVGAWALMAAGVSALLLLAWLCFNFDPYLN